MLIHRPNLTRAARRAIRRRRGTRASIALVICFSLLASCSSADGATTPSGTSDTPPSALVGKWRVTAAASGSVCDQVGSCSGADGGSESYLFTADGHFEFTQYLQSDLLGCRIVATLYAKGTMSVNGASMTLAATYAHQSKQANCESSFERDLTIDPTAYTWWTTKDAAGKPQLFIKGGSGTDGPFDLVP